MAFDDAAAYAQFMGRFSEPLAVSFAGLSGVRQGQTALDVGCGGGALTAELVRRLGVSAVSACDPSEAFVAATRARFPGVEVTQAVAERLPYDDDAYDVVLAQLVVHFLDDPAAGIAEMARVTRPGGRVAACVWDGELGPLGTFGRAVRDLDPDTAQTPPRAGTREGHLAELLAAAGLGEVEAGGLDVRVGFSGFEEWWAPYTLRVGPPGDHVASLDASARERLRSRCAELLPEGPFEVTARAWTAVGRA